MKTKVLLDHEVQEAGHVLRVLLQLEADVHQRADRLPLNLSLVLDRSGSMQGEKLIAARSAAAQLVRRLAREDRVSVVAYDDEVTTIAEPATGEAQADLPRRIEEIESGGSTNLSGGWLRGRELVAGGLLDNGVNRVILLTDGRANMGIQDAPRLTGLCANGKKAGVTTTTIGFGEDYDEKLLRAMADAGGGNMYYIESVDQASAVFADELKGLLEIGAQNVVVSIEQTEYAEFVVVHHEYPRTVAPDNITLQLGDLYAREPKPLLIEILVTRDVTSKPVVANFRITADVVTAEGGVEHQVITIPITVSPEDANVEQPDVRRELLLLEVAKARREALDARDRGDYGGAVRALREARVRVKGVAGNDAELLEETHDLQAMENLFAAQSVNSADEKYMRQRSYNSSSGRRMKDALISRKPKEEPPKP